ncbi:MAG: hypothetical protein WCG27_12805 [Pseudomonadota bacterium]
MSVAIQILFWPEHPTNFFTREQADRALKMALMIINKVKEEIHEWPYFDQKKTI